MLKPTAINAKIKNKLLNQKKKLNENNSFSFYMYQKLTEELTKELLCWQTMLHYFVI